MIAVPLVHASLEGCNSVNEHGFNPLESFEHLIDYYRENVRNRPDVDEWVLDNIKKN